jgi:hypothetical protein
MMSGEVDFSILYVSFRPLISVYVKQWKVSEEWQLCLSPLKEGPKSERL